jgi:hypothetical protein
VTEREPRLPPIFIGDLFDDDDDDDGDPIMFDLGNILNNTRNAASTYRFVQDTLDPPQPTLADRAWSLVDGDPATTIANPVRTAVMPKKTGCRRRRRRLLTKSDLGDIAALKGIVGTGKNFENILSAAMYRSR